MVTRDWEKRYRTGDLPWDVGSVDPHLQHAIEEYRIAPCRVLEIGLGTGTNAIWLVGQGFAVTGIDVAPTAIAMAREKIERAGVSVEMVRGNILQADIPGGPFGFVYDRGCFHTFDTREDREALANTVAKYLGADGMWFSMIGSSDGPPRGVGPPRRSAADIVKAVESLFRIICLEATTFNPAKPDSPEAWACLMRKR